MRGFLNLLTMGLVLGFSLTLAACGHGGASLPVLTPAPAPVPVVTAPTPVPPPVVTPIANPAPAPEPRGGPVQIGDAPPETPLGPASALTVGVPVDAVVTSDGANQFASVIVGQPQRGWRGPGSIDAEGSIESNGVMTINGNVSAPMGFKNDVWLGIQGPDGKYTSFEAVAFEDGLSAYPGIQFVTFGCTRATICPLAAQKVAGAVGFNAWNGKGDTTDSAVLGMTTELQTLTANGMDLEFWYTPNGSTAFTRGAALSPNGRGGFIIGNPQGGEGNAGTLNIEGPYFVNGKAGVSCSGPPTAAYQVTDGIVTHC